MDIDQQPYVIVGVMPAGMAFPDGAEGDRLVGAVPFTQLSAWIEPHMAPAA